MLIGPHHSFPWSRWPSFQLCVLMVGVGQPPSYIGCNKKLGSKLGYENVCPAPSRCAAESLVKSITSRHTAQRCCCPQDAPLIWSDPAAKCIEIRLCDYSCCPGGMKICHFGKSNSICCPSDTKCSRGNASDICCLTQNNAGQSICCPSGVGINCHDGSHCCLGVQSCVPNSSKCLTTTIEPTIGPRGSVWLESVLLLTISAILICISLSFCCRIRVAQRNFPLHRLVLGHASTSSARESFEGSSALGTSMVLRTDETTCENEHLSMNLSSPALVASSSQTIMQSEETGNIESDGFAPTVSEENARAEHIYQNPLGAADFYPASISESTQTGDGLDQCFRCSRIAVLKWRCSGEQCPGGPRAGPCYLCRQCGTQDCPLCKQPVRTDDFELLSDLGSEYQSDAGSSNAGRETLRIRIAAEIVRANQAEEELRNTRAELEALRSHSSNSSFSM